VKGASSIYFTMQKLFTKASQITKVSLFVPVSFVTGEGLAKNIGTLYGLCVVVLNDNSDKDTKDVGVVLFITSNTVS
jgi:hypothetical protein